MRNCRCNAIVVSPLRIASNFTSLSRLMRSASLCTQVYIGCNYTDWRSQPLLCINYFTYLSTYLIHATNLLPILTEVSWSWSSNENFQIVKMKQLEIKNLSFSCNAMLLQFWVMRDDIWTSLTASILSHTSASPLYNKTHFCVQQNSWIQTDHLIQRQFNAKDLHDKKHYFTD